MAKFLIITGLLIISFGVFMHFFGDKMNWFGNMFGDIKIIKSSYRFYFPITSMVIISIILTLIINFVNRFFN